MTSEMILDYKTLETTNLKFTKLEENNRSKGQMIAYPKYMAEGVETGFFMQSPWIKLYTYGVPKQGEYYKTDEDRLHLRVPFDRELPQVDAYAKKLMELDAYMSSDEMKQEIFGKKASKYTYQPIYREGQEQIVDSDDEEAKKKPKAPRPPYMKIKIDTRWEDKKISSTIFESALDKETNKRVRTKVDGIDTIDDFSRIICWNSTVRFIAKGVKLWAHQSSKKDAQYGIVFKLVKIEVEPTAKVSNMYKQLYNNDTFNDSDNEETVFKPIIDKVEKKVAAEEEDSDDAEESEDLPKPTKIVEVESDDDDDEEEDDDDDDDKKEEKKPLATKIVEVESDEDEDEEEEVVPKKIEKKTAVKKSKK